MQCFLGSSQTLDTIVWSASNRLEWKDFRAKPKPSFKAAAITASGITYSFSSIARGSAVSAEFKVFAYFYPDKSWYKPQICDDFVLMHEQLHFDITELYARKFRKRLSEITFSLNIKNEVNDVYTAVLEELHNLQELYDWETTFSINREAQVKWNTKITNQLEALSDWQ